MFDFTAASNWQSIFYFGLIAGLLILANTLRRKIPLLKKSLLPTAVIAGFIGLLLKELVYAPLVGETSVLELNQFFSMITYHAIALGFIALGLKVNEKRAFQIKRGQSFFSGMLIVSTYLIQGIVGLGVTLLLSYTFVPDLFQASGILFPLGFGQGPGQALNIGTVYETTYGFTGGASFGLAIASFGFLWAAFFGVIYLNYLVKKGKVAPRKESLDTFESPQLNTSPDEIPLAESIDKFTVQMMIVLFVYFVTYGFIRLTTDALNTGILGDFGADTIGPLLWGFNFIFGMLFALATRQLLKLFRANKLMTRQYPNNFLLNRIAGFVFDIMIVASIVAIRAEDLASSWLLLLVLGLIVGLVTAWFMITLTRRLYPEYKDAAMLGMFGMLTGTASTGVILIREVDPEFKTPAASDLVVGSSTAIIFGFPILLLVGIAPISTPSTWLVLGILIALFSLFTGLLLYFNPKVKL